MSNILYVAFPFYGHVNPTFSTMHTLRERGHNVLYLTFNQEIIEHIRLQGFDAKNIPNIYDGWSTPSKLPIVGKLVTIMRGVRGFVNNLQFAKSPACRTLVDSLVGDFGPDIIMFDAQLSMIAPLFWHHSQKMLLYATQLPLHRDPNVPPLSSNVVPTNSKLVKEEWDKYDQYMKRVTRLPKLAGLDYVKQIRAIGEYYDFPVDRYFDPTRQSFPGYTFPEIIGTPREFDYPAAQWPDRMVAGGPGISTNVKHKKFETFEKDPDKPLIYCSFGTILLNLQRQSLRDKFHRIFCDIARQMPDCQFLVIAKSAQQTGESPPSNLVFRGFVNQLAVLEQASVHLTHGGLGSVKESMWTGTPMLVFPLGADAFGNAARIYYHSAGETTQLLETPVETIVAQLRRLLENPRYQEGTQKLQAMLKKSAEEQADVRAVEKFLAQ